MNILVKIILLFLAWVICFNVWTLKTPEELASLDKLIRLTALGVAFLLIAMSSIFGVPPKDKE